MQAISFICSRLFLSTCQNPTLYGQPVVHNRYGKGIKGIKSFCNSSVISIWYTHNFFFLLLSDLAFCFQMFSIFPFFTSQTTLERKIYPKDSSERCYFRTLFYLSILILSFGDYSVTKTKTAWVLHRVHFSKSRLSGILPGV